MYFITKVWYWISFINATHKLDEKLFYKLSEVYCEKQSITK